MAFSIIPVDGGGRIGSCVRVSVYVCVCLRVCVSVYVRIYIYIYIYIRGGFII